MKHQQLAYVVWNWQTLDTLISEAVHAFSSSLDAQSLKSLDLVISVCTHAIGHQWTVHHLNLLLLKWHLSVEQSH